MTETLNIDDIVAGAARAKLGKKNFIRAMSEPAIASDGSEALRITLVIEPNAVEALKGGAVIDTLVEIHKRLLDEGEERFPIVEYATESELADGDSES